MIAISKLYCGLSFGHDPLRYGRPVEPGLAARAHGIAASAAERRPVTVWTMTRTCNLGCIHCYTDSGPQRYAGELNGDEARALLDDLAAFKIPALLLSGGEPLLREDFFDLAAYARRIGLRTTVSTNATLITDEAAGKLREAGILYVGASLDGIGEVNDRFRGMDGAFRLAAAGMRRATAAGLPVGLRLTLTRHNASEIDSIFDFVEAEDIDRVCFYHLAYSGRGRAIRSEDLSPAETRRTMDLILARTRRLAELGLHKDVLTVDQHADGAYLYLKLLEEDPERAEEVRELLEWNGGGLNSSGVGIGNVGPDGEVHPDQFWQDYSLGNVRERPFSEIWMDTSDPLMAGLKDRLPLLKGRCGGCRFRKICGGSLRVRACHATGDPWAEDPACYLTDAEIGQA